MPRPPGPSALADLEHRALTFGGETRDVWVTGQGPAVIVMHEVPGLYPEVVAFGQRVAAAGFTVWLPSVIGEPGRAFGLGYNVRSLARACVAREFSTWAMGRNSPITIWLRALAAHAHGECGGPGVGAVGMCLTGGLALAMAADDRLLAPVLSQPSLPFAATPARARDLGIDAETLAAVQRRTREDGLCVLGLRFSADRMAPAARFRALREALGDAFIAVEIDSGWGNPHGLKPWAHSVLVRDVVEAPGHPTVAARDQVIAFFQSRLLGEGAG